VKNRFKEVQKVYQKMNAQNYKQMRQSRSRVGRRGSVLVEAAVSIAFLLLPLLVGIVQFGILYNATNSLSQIAREGGRFAAVWGRSADDPTTPGNEGSDQYIRDRITSVQNQTNLKGLALTVNITPADRASRQQYGEVTVTVGCDMSSLAFFPVPGLKQRLQSVTRNSVVMLER
jgi:Flp pilus assembly protein TadG